MPEAERAEPHDWPLLPVDVRPMRIAPTIGLWVWVIPEKVRYSSFHEVVRVETVRADGRRLRLVQARCGLAWPLEQLAVAVPSHHRALDREADGRQARCGNCASDSTRTRRNFWSKHL
jgi:hypothetical protein